MRSAQLEEKYEPLRDKLVYFYSYDPREILDPYGAGKNPEMQQYKTIVDDMQEMITDTENNGNAEENAILAALVHASTRNNYDGYKALKNNIKNLRENKNYFFGIITTSPMVEGYAHALLYIVHKNNNTIRYYFMDPINRSFTHEGSIGQRYRISINRLKKFIEQPTLLDNAMVRNLRYMYKDNKAFKKAIQDYGLSDNDIYKEFYS